MAGGVVFGAAIVALAFALGGIIVYLIDSATARVICAAGRLACSQAWFVANTSLALGAAGLVVGVLLLVMVLKD